MSLTGELGLRGSGVDGFLDNQESFSSLAPINFRRRKSSLQWGTRNVNQG